MSRIVSVPARAMIALLLGLAAAIAFSTPAAAHSAIIDSTPQAGEELQAAPDVFSITANEDLANVTGTGEGFALRIVDTATGADLATGQLTIDGATLSTPGVPLAGGSYLMQYQVVSADGHPISGEIAFTVAGGPTPVPAEPGGTPSDGSGGQTAETPAWQIWLAVVLAILLATLITLIVMRRRRMGGGPRGA